MERIMVKIKVCGLTERQEAEWLREEGVDLAGMILFFPRSKRNITLEQAEGILQTLGQDIRRVAVVVSPTREQVRSLQSLPFDLIQIHGELRPEVLEELSIPFLRAFNVDNMWEWERFNTEKACAGYVFDAQVPGSGQTFDWGLVPPLPEGGKPMLLAGGLNPDNVVQALDRIHPDGVDVSSGVERDSGKGKDPEKIRAFVRAVRRWEEAHSVS